MEDVSVMKKDLSNVLEHSGIPEEDRTGA